MLLVGMSAEDCEFGRLHAPCLVHSPALTGVRRTHPGDVRWFWSLALLRAGLGVVQTDADALPLSADIVPLLCFGPAGKGAPGVPPAAFFSAFSDRDYHGAAPGHPKMAYCRDRADAPCQVAALPPRLPPVRGAVPPCSALVMRVEAPFRARSQPRSSICGRGRRSWRRCRPW